MKKIDRIFKNSKKVEIDDSTKIVIMSDCHRGIKNNEDNFNKNQTIYNSALQYYYKNDFIYIELGDGDEMWEVKKYEEIVENYIETFKKLKKFHDKGNLFMIYGNHDIVKRKPAIMKKYFYEYENKSTREKSDLLPNLSVSESLVLKYKNHDIFLVHGHQVDTFNSTFWPISRFLVRYIWKKIESIGVKDPTSAAKNYKVKSKVEKKLQKWSEDNNKILIAGHTHRPIFPQIGNSLYFNDGSCVHPNGVTAIEIEEGKISLVKWSFDVNEFNQIIVKRFVIDGGESIEKFFKPVDVNS